MKSSALKFILPALILMMVAPALMSQEIKSEKVKILVNTKDKPMEPATDIQLLEPKDLQQGVTFLTEVQALPLIIKLQNPAQGLKVLVNNVEILPNPNGDFYTHTYTLSKGSNSLYISLLKDNKEIKDLSYTVIYSEPVKNLSPFVTPEGKYYALIIAKKD